MRVVKLVTLVVGGLVVVLAVILDEVNERNDVLAAGLILFSLTASTYFLAWPVSRDDETSHHQGYKFYNPHTPARIIHRFLSRSDESVDLSAKELELLLKAKYLKHEFFKTAYLGQATEFGKCRLATTTLYKRPLLSGKSKARQTSD